jgi:hypothetical protein
MSISSWKRCCRHVAIAAAASGALVCSAHGVRAADWSVTEIQLQYGKLDNPFTGSSTETPIVTLQHASGHKFGDVFFFVDLSDDDIVDGFNDKDAYGEFYAYFSSAKILGATYGGLIKDIGVVLGVNYGADSGYLGYFPGVYIDWNAPAFKFLRTQATAIIDDSSYAQKDGWQIDTQWGYGFEIGGQRFSFEGHWEYTGNYGNAFGPQKDWFLIQPQLRWDVGYALTGKADVVFLGTEYQYWNNKLGADLDESAFQALAVWRF